MLILVQLHVVLLLGGLSESTTYMYTPKPVLTPSVVVTYTGGSIILTCTKPDLNMEIAWFTDLIPLVFRLEDKHNITFESDINDISYNNSLIYCIGRYPSDPIQANFSNPSVLLIQGRLSQVYVNITLQNTEDICSAILYWDPPFTLSGVPILGYNINITNTVTNKTQPMMFVTETQAHVPLGYYIVSIAGVNPVGEGNISTIHVDLFNYGKEFNFSRNIFVKQAKAKWIFELYIDKDKFCKDTDRNVSISFCINNSCTNITNTTRQFDNETIVIIASVSLDDNVRQYSVYVALVNGNFTIKYHSMEYISTFDVQGIQVISTTNETLCLSVTYVSGSVATGCHIELQCPNETLITFNITGAVGCIDTTGVNGVKTCIVRGYDVVNGNIEYGPAAVLMDDVTISGLIRPTGSMISHSVSSTDPTGNMSNSIGISVVTSVLLILLILLLMIIIIIVKVFLNKRQSQGVFSTALSYNQEPNILHKSNLSPDIFKTIPKSSETDNCNSGSTLGPKSMLRKRNSSSLDRGDSP